jgi:hypothetical protein
MLVDLSYAPNVMKIKEGEIDINCDLPDKADTEKRKRCLIIYFYRASLYHEES